MTIEDDADIRAVAVRDSASGGWRAGSDRGAELIHRKRDVEIAKKSSSRPDSTRLQSTSLRTRRRDSFVADRLGYR